MNTRTQGVYLRFFIHENRRHKGLLMYEWLLELARKEGIRGGTAFRSIAGFGRHGVMHEQHFFELAGDVTVRVDFLVSAAESAHLLKLVEAENIVVPYAELPAEFGVTGNDG